MDGRVAAAQCLSVLWYHGYLPSTLSRENQYGCALVARVQTALDISPRGWGICLEPCFALLYPDSLHRPSPVVQTNQLFGGIGRSAAGGVSERLITHPGVHPVSTHTHCPSVIQRAHVSNNPFAASPANHGTSWQVASGFALPSRLVGWIHQGRESDGT